MSAKTKETRLSRLRDLADECLDIYSDETRQALESGRSSKVPRYALMTSEGSAESAYRDNPNLTVHETKEALADQIAGELDEGWSPLQVIDLETGKDLDYKVRVEIATPTETKAARRFEEARRVERQPIKVGETYTFYSTGHDETTRVRLPGEASKDVLLRSLTGRKVEVTAQLPEDAREKGSEPIYSVRLADDPLVTFDAFEMELNGFGFDTGQFYGPAGEWGSTR